MEPARGPGPPAVQAIRLISLVIGQKQHGPRGRGQGQLQENEPRLINQQLPQDYTNVAAAGASVEDRTSCR